MGVINRNEILYPKNPNQSSSTESLHIPGSSNNSTNSSVTNIAMLEPILNIRRRKRRTNATNIPLGSPRHVGRRRLRRYNAVCELEALIEEEEEDTDTEVISHRSPFTIILENPDLEHVWDNLIKDDENNDLTIIDELIPLYSKPQVATAYTNISFRIRMSFKMLRGFHELERQEQEILDFFSKNPHGYYINANKNSFQRLLLHGIAQYYCLRSTSFDDETGNRVIKVTKPYEDCIVSEQRLLKIIEGNHSMA